MSLRLPGSRRLIIAALFVSVPLVALLRSDGAEKKPPAPSLPPPVFTYLLIHRPGPGNLRPGDDRGAAANFEAYKQTLAALVNSRFVVEVALGDIVIRAEPVVRAHSPGAVAWLEQALVVDFPRNGDVLRIGLAAEPKQANDILDAVVQAFMEKVVEHQRAELLAYRQKLGNKYSAFKSELAGRRRAMVDLERQLEPGPPPDSTAASHAATKIAALDQEAAEMRRAIADLNVKLAKAEEVAPSQFTEDTAAKRTPESKKAAAARVDIMVELEIRKRQLASIAAQISEIENKTKEQLAAAQREHEQIADAVRPEAELEQIEISRLQRLISDLGAAVDRMDLEIDGPPRVERLGGERSN